MAGTQDEGNETGPAEPVVLRRRGLPWRFRMLVFFASLVLLALLVLIPVHLTSASSYCTSCHAMKAAGASWSQSVHAKVECVQCHVNPGLSNAVVWRTEEARNIWASYLDAGKGMAASVQRPSNAACEQCHAVKDLPTVIKGIKTPHGIHLMMRNLMCTDCHNHVSHVSPGQSTSVDMSVCTMCHNGREAANSCATCHTTPPPASVHPSNYIATHGRDARGRVSDCQRCHHDSVAFCDACHSRRPATHFVGSWSYTHGAQAKATNAGCLGCHKEQSFCAQCHQVDHPADWATSHAAVARRGTASCLVCHPQQMCDSCHAQKGVSP